MLICGKQEENSGFRILEIPIGFPRFPRDSQDSHGIPMIPKGFLRFSRDSRDSQRIPLRTSGIPWKFRKSNGNPGNPKSAVSPLHPRVKNEVNQIGAETLNISPFFNNKSFSDDVFSIYTTIDALHTDALKTIFRRPGQYSGFS